MKTSIEIALPAYVVTNVFLLGIVLAIPYVYRILDFLWLYFLRPSSVKHYLHGAAPYAIVTGATDGIGKATAAELLTRGFNVILHGRNEAKMKGVVEELRAAVRGKGKADMTEIRYFIADAAKSGHDFAKLVAPFKDLHITVVVHNVGGSDLYPQKYVRPLICDPLPPSPRAQLTNVHANSQDRPADRRVPPERREQERVLLAPPHARAPAPAPARGAVRTRARPLRRIRRGRYRPASPPALRRVQRVPAGARARAGQRRGALWQAHRRALHISRRGRGALGQPRGADLAQPDGADERAVWAGGRRVDWVRAEEDRAVLCPRDAVVECGGYG